MKFFNTAGPVNRDKHYKIDPLHRWDLDEILLLIQQEKYFVLHAPRQTGKTSCLLALCDYLNNEKQYNCVYANFEAGQTARADVAEGISAVLSELHGRIIDTLNIEIPFLVNEIITTNGSHKALNAYLNAITKLLNKPLVLFIDEIDSLVGDTLISVLRQLRSGYDTRPGSFPVSVILCGVRDIKDYRIRTSGQEIITGGSAFNIKAKSLRLGNFTKEDVKTLLLEHTKETGQVFEDNVAPYIYNETDGQPWLVNAIAYELTFEMKENRDYKVVLTKEMTEVARNRVILSRATHLDQLADKLSEDRVRRVILPMLQNIEAKSNTDDKQYCIDLGLIKSSSKGLVIANNIYREIIPRELTESRQDDFLMRFSPDWVSEDGSMDTEILFNMFTQFWRENSEIWASSIAGYQEAAPHLVFQAYLQRVANGGGYVFREYGLGRGRTDLMLKWSPSASSGTGANEQRIVIELKVYSKGVSLKALKEKALVQTLEYAKKLGSTENHIIIFDRDDQTDWREKLYTETCEFEGESFKIWGV
ncbi:MAG: AAA-like domain-containing protein [Spirochaetota bacterium]|nr:AAA-like domain-containing protein [Spirochaetota bacterium]